MKTVKIHRAEDTGGRHVEPVMITIGTTIPTCEGDGWLERNQAIFDADAQALAEALHRSLPGGTWIRLIAAVLTEHAKEYNFVVARGEP